MTWHQWMEARTDEVVQEEEAALAEVLALHHSYGSYPRNEDDDELSVGFFGEEEDEDDEDDDDRF